MKGYGIIALLLALLADLQLGRVDLRPTTTEHFIDLGKLKLHMVVCFRLEPIFSTVPAASKNDACFKSGQKQHKINHLASLI